MLDRRRLGRHARGLVVLFAGLFLALSLAGYDPSDPPGGSSWTPGPAAPRNPCGPVGATLAHALVATVGMASWLALYGVAVVDLLIFRRRPIPDPAPRALGFALVLATSASALQALAPGLGPGPPVGSGGYVGALAVTFLGGQFGAAGMVLILAASGLAGLALCHELLVAWPLQELARPLGLARRPPGAAAPSPYANPPAVPALARPPHDYAAPRLAGPPGARPPAPRPPMPADAPGPAVPSLMPAVRQHEAGCYVPIPSDGSYMLPPPELLDPPAAFPVQEHEAKINSRALLLEKTLLEHGCSVRVVQIDTGPVITQFEIELEAGLRVSKVAGLSNDLAIALAVPSVRIVAPIPGKTTVGIEVPNDRRAIVRLGEVIAGTLARLEKARIPLFLGKDVKGQSLAFDLGEMPHLLIAGRTGTGKSVCLNAMILSILMTRRPDEVKLILIDPKMVELSQFKRIPHLMHPVITDMKKAESVLAWACEKMDERYAFLARAGVRNIQAYNALGPDEILARLQPETDEERQRIPTHMPYIVIIADEMADLMMTAAKEVEQHIVRLAQKSRAVGMHLIIATQKPTVDVITGLIKGNLPARIAFQVSSRGDSRVVLDEMGADKLLGNGDMLFLLPGTSHIVRAQGTYVSDAEVNKVCAYLEQYPVEFSKEMMQLQVGGGLSGKDRGAAMKERDELYESAIEIVIREGRGSTSLLQRALGIGYGRAARLIDFMAEDGIVGEYKSGSAREVLYTWEEWESFKDGGDPGEAAA
jgi:S-DNA-T family DNA segregation ATPase FtsK/SpoIIIE